MTIAKHPSIAVGRFVAIPTHGSKPRGPIESERRGFGVASLLPQFVRISRFSSANKETPARPNCAIAFIYAQPLPSPLNRKSWCETNRSRAVVDTALISNVVVVGFHNWTAAVWGFSSRVADDWSGWACSPSSCRSNAAPRRQSRQCPERRRTPRERSAISICARRRVLALAERHHHRTDCRLIAVRLIKLSRRSPLVWA